MSGILWLVYLRSYEPTHQHCSLRNIFNNNERNFRSFKVTCAPHHTIKFSRLETIIISQTTFPCYWTKIILHSLTPDLLTSCYFQSCPCAHLTLIILHLHFFIFFTSPSFAILQFLRINTSWNWPSNFVFSCKCRRQTWSLGPKRSFTKSIENQEWRSVSYSYSILLLFKNLFTLCL